MGFGVIDFESVSKTFRRGDSALSELTVSIPSQRITALVGEAGSGKSTMLQLINRTIEPTSGRIVWDGNPITSVRKRALRRRIGYLGPDDGLFPHRTVAENVATVPRLLGWSASKTNTRVRESLTDLGLGSKLSARYPDQLSSKERCRVGLARALAGDPSMVLLDNPFGFLDADDRRELQGVLLKLQLDQARTVIVTTDSIDEALTVAGHVVVLRPNGRLAQAADPQTLLDAPADDFVASFVGVDRGYRSLSFLRAETLELDTVRVVREVGAASGEGPTLVVDGNARPVGWADPERPGEVIPLGSTFEPQLDTLKVALDSALTSRFGLAVAVEAGTGRYSGVATASAIIQAASKARTAVDAPAEGPAPEDLASGDSDSVASASEEVASDDLVEDQAASEEADSNDSTFDEWASEQAVAEDMDTNQPVEDQPVSDEALVDDAVPTVVRTDHAAAEGLVAGGPNAGAPNTEESPSGDPASTTVESSRDGDTHIVAVSDDSEDVTR